MLIEALRLAAGLNSASAQVANVPEVEHALLRNGLVMHVTDPDDVLGLGEPASTVRVALTRAVREAGEGASWAVALPRHGRSGGLRGPRPLTEAALLAATGDDDLTAAVVVPHAGGAAWLPHLLGFPETEAVQWRLWRADRPLVELTPSEASRSLTTALMAAAERLQSLGVSGGTRPSSTSTVRLGPAYPDSSQVLLDRALVVLDACRAALSSPDEVLHSHGVLTRERELGSLVDVCHDVVQACVSWPTHAMR
ncbi:hypothetical protein [Aestuariimicrobium kwangyangense]|uniref:hypothetical protein n=1 Tax=Aestuariimicrobium kwangyangense TaxID=396389 RepID=UPI0003B61ECB|nr:hypothetical protein [Aestuariimicrobium kwangyangense]